jgi:protein-S-isoprenylcysteine O-methyltransferase Ste14
MPALKTAVTITWIVFWVYWLVSALGSKAGRRAEGRVSPARGLTGVAVIVLLVAFRGAGLAVNDAGLEIVGAVIFAAGIGLAIWARVHLGGNWGMPMSQKVEPELVTSGPYRFVRHPIYTGLLVAVLGTALVTSLVGLAIVAILGGYFWYSATVEERNLIGTFPKDYPAYMARTKMLIPFVL